MVFQLRLLIMSHGHFLSWHRRPQEVFGHVPISWQVRSQKCQSCIYGPKLNYFLLVFQ